MMTAALLGGLWSSPRTASAVQQSGGRCTNVNLATAPPSPQAPGTSVTFTATNVIGCATPEYEFWVEFPDGVWRRMQPYSGVSSFIWNTSGQPAGRYSIQVWVRQAGAADRWQAYEHISYLLQTGTPAPSPTPTPAPSPTPAPTATPTPTPAAGGTRCTSVNLSAQPASPQPPGATIQLTASGVAGCNNPQYQFWMQAPNGAWSIVQPYGPGNVFNWNTTGRPTGSYSFQVWVRQSGAGESWQAYAHISYALQSTGPTPTPSATPTPTPSPSPGGSCASLQGMVDRAVAGSVVTVPPCIYRESVNITKALTLQAQPGAEIRGSDIWTGWTRSGATWVSQKTLPSLPSTPYGSVQCQSGTSRCQWPEQVFIDGRPLVQVAAGPASGQFAVDGSRRVVLGEDPSGHTVEVTTRTRWLTGRASGITVRGFTMQHAANGAQEGALSFNGQGDCTIEGNTLVHAHGWTVHVCTRMRLVGNDIGYSGQLAVGGTANDSLLSSNRLHHSNTEAFDPNWEAGGLKLVRTQRTVVEQNESYSNDGPGLWCDIDCDGVTFRSNRVHHNTRIGIHYEISRNGKIHDNTVWENGWGYRIWGVGGGITISNSSSTEVYRNTVAWNADGITVLQANRGSATWNSVTNVFVHDNSIFTVDDPADGERYSLGWLQSLAGGNLYSSSSNNRASNNTFWYPGSEGAMTRYAWSSNYRQLAPFTSTAGGAGSRYMSTTDRDQVLTQASVPSSPQ